MGDKGKYRVSQKPRGRAAGQSNGDIGLPSVVIAAASGTRQEEWAVKNGRRIALIAKQFSQGLDPDEQVELKELQAEADRYLDEVAPLPFEHLQKLEQRAGLPAVDRIGSGNDQADPA